jgi:hypothetical protein
VEKVELAKKQAKADRYWDNVKAMEKPWLGNTGIKPSLALLYAAGWLPRV